MTCELPVAGHCPMGCGETLQRRDLDSAIVCAADACPRPDAVDTILREQETEHIVQFDEDGFTIRHPLRERLDDALMHCELHRHCTRLPGPPRDGAGQYRAIFLGPRDWVFQRREGA
ncbi:DUF6085 family protein [Streptomyces sp. NBC_01485]|uniref:DUF6085 family protein n=1 Tax=Streptomyces sp. NBC_01485 TaxID=2903884 RepID=UPI002E331D09|nr:DUF6085 family protein [Streptomyces sp. NBC_01485]